MGPLGLVAAAESDDIRLLLVIKADSQLRPLATARTDHPIRKSVLHRVLRAYVTPAAQTGLAGGDVSEGAPRIAPPRSRLGSRSRLAFQLGQSDTDRADRTSLRRTPTVSTRRRLLSSRNLSRPGRQNG
jgi:hypothetical protein